MDDMRMLKRRPVLGCPFAGGAPEAGALELALVGGTNASPSSFVVARALCASNALFAAPGAGAEPAPGLLLGRTQAGASLALSLVAGLPFPSSPR